MGRSSESTLVTFVILLNCAPSRDYIHDEYSKQSNKASVSHGILEIVTNYVDSLRDVQIFNRWSDAAYRFGGSHLTCVFFCVDDYYH